MNSQNVEDARKQELFEKLLRNAYIHRRRGDYGQAVQLIRQALDIRPDDLEAREFGADMLFVHGELEKAAEQYKSILEEDQARASAEEKYAKTILQITEGKRQKELLQAMLDNPTKYRTPNRSPGLVVVLSAIPGCGHMYLGQFLKGIILFVAAVLVWMLVAITAPDLRPELFTDTISAWFVLFLCSALSLHIYALLDSASVANKQRANADASHMAEPE